MVLDYSKFDRIGDDDEELDAQLRKEREYQRSENGAKTHLARGLLADPLMSGVMDDLHDKSDRDRKLKIDGTAREALITFIVIQAHGAGEVDNTSCAPAIIEFMQSGKAPKVSLMLAFVWAMQKRIDASERPATETEPLRSLLMGALNTLLSISKKESAEALFNHLKRAPESEFAKRYFAREFARARFEKYAAAAHHAETRWYYGDDIPWRDYTPQNVQDALDGACTLCESRPKLMFACATVVALIAAAIYDKFNEAQYYDVGKANFPTGSASLLSSTQAGAGVVHDEV